MRFSGRLQIEADPHNWLKADLMVARGRVELMAGSDLLGSWSTSQVVAERVEADRFSLHLGEDRALFIADDALSFSYEAIPQLNKRQLIPVGGVMDKLKAGLRGDDAREPTVVPDPGGPVPAESAVATTGKRLRELIKEAAGYSPPTVAVETPGVPAVEKKTGHTLDAVLRWRPGVKADAGTEPKDLEADAGGEGELSTEDLLERLFDAPDAAAEDRVSVEQVPTPGPLWAATPRDAQPQVMPDRPSPAEVAAGAEVPVVVDPPVVARPPVVADPPFATTAPVTEPPMVAKPAVETWQKEELPLEVWHKTEQPVDLSPSHDSQWGRSTMDWPSNLQTEASGKSALIESLGLIVADVKSGAMSAEQVQAVTALIEAITKAVGPKF